jgi:phosphatidylglycerol---prolipoprotein diacylglyceryl transferase
VFPLIPIAPDPIALSFGPINIGWYGIGYVIALAVMLLVTQTEVERRGISRTHVWNALLLVGALALIGGRLYHVIDQWQLYKDNLLAIILPPYAGLGLYGGVLGAAIGIIIYTRWQHLPLRLSLDSVIAGTLFAQGIARWGNFFNQELYGPPTDAPWGIVIDCAHRVAQYPCSLYPFETTGFHPLFFYESVLNILGGFIVLFLSRRYLAKLQPGDLVAFWGIWYGTTRSLLETFREGWNWTVSGIPTAQLIGITLAIVGVVWIAYNHRPGTKPYPYPEPIRPPPPPPDPFAEEEDEGFADDFADADADATETDGDETANGEDDETDDGDEPDDKADDETKEPAPPTSGS